MKVVLDTNVIISALIFGGKPDQILTILEETILFVAISSPILKAELMETLDQKFRFIPEKIKQTELYFDENFGLVYPNEDLKIVRDEDDNRVLEAVVEGKCQYIITGDRDLLDLNEFKGIKIVTPAQFLEIVSA